MGRGAHITKDMCFPGRGTHITRDMCFSGEGTHITRDMCFQVGEHLSLGICVCQGGEHISLGVQNARHLLHSSYERHKLKRSYTHYMYSMLILTKRSSHSVSKVYFQGKKL